MKKINGEGGYNTRMAALMSHLITLSAPSAHLRKAAAKVEDREYHSGRLSIINDIIDFLEGASE